MRVVEASAVVPLSPEEAWDLLIGDQMHRLVEMPEISVVAVEDPLLARSMQQDLDALAKRFGPQEDQERRPAAYPAVPGIIVLVAASVLLLYFLRRRSRTRRR